MRNYLIALLVAAGPVLGLGGALGGCGDNLRSSAEALASPPTVTPRAAGELAVSWPGDPLATSYSVFQSENDGAPQLVASVFDSGGGAPATSYVATGLTAGTRYCFAIQATLPDGSTGDASAQGCSAAAVIPGSTRTMPIAINGPRVGPGPGFQGDALYMNGAVQSAVFQISGIPVGSTIVGAHVRVRDSAIGPTPLIVDLIPSTDGNQDAPIASSRPSAGTGLPQTLDLSGLSTTIAPLTSYSIYVSNTRGIAQVSVLAIDVDYIPAS